VQYTLRYCPASDRWGLERQRATRLATLTRALDSRRYLAVLDALVSFVHEPPLEQSDYDVTRPDVAAVKRLADKQWKRLRKAVGPTAPRCERPGAARGPQACEASA
jgi:hypothetical protein